MAKLTDSIHTFQTGDLVFTRYPPRGTQPIHVTLFLEARTGLGRSYVHAGATHLEIADAATYADDKGAGGYLHAHPADATVRANTAMVAQLFASTVKRTPYGSYPGRADFERMSLAPVSPHASRFTGMIRTGSIDEIHFEFPALRRLLKWTLRAIERSTLSENRGITCAAFIAVCHQVARMRAFLDETGVSYHPEKIRACIQKIDAMTETKAMLRKDLELLGSDPANGKPIYRDQAYRENSNRKLTEDGRGAMVNLAKNVAWGELDSTIVARLKPDAPIRLPYVEKVWLVIQTQMLDIPKVSARLLEDIIGSDFLFDAKYVSSPLLAERIRNAMGWNTTEYTNY